MDQPLTTVATFSTPLEAELARNRLEEQGIVAFVADAEAAGLWHLGGAFGSVKLQVAESDASAARVILARGPARAGLSGKDDYGLETAIQRGRSRPPRGADHDEEEEEEDTESDTTAARAWRAAVIGLLVLPPLLHFYAAWLLFQLPWTRGPLSPVGKWKAFGAALLTVAAVLGATLLLRALVMPPFPGQKDGQPAF